MVLTPNFDKTKLISFGPTLCNEEASDVECAGGKVQHVTSFKCLGSIIYQMT